MISSRTLSHDPSSPVEVNSMLTTPFARCSLHPPTQWDLLYADLVSRPRPTTQIPRVGEPTIDAAFRTLFQALENVQNELREMVRLKRKANWDAQERNGSAQHSGTVHENVDSTLSSSSSSFATSSRPQPKRARRRHHMDTN